MDAEVESGMTTADAERIIAALTKKHKLFRLLGFQCHDRGMFMTFESVDIDPKTIAKWIDGVGCYALYIGSEGTGDNRIMCAEVRI